MNDLFFLFGLDIVGRRYAVMCTEINTYLSGVQLASIYCKFKNY